MSYIKKEPLCAWLSNMGVSDYIIQCIKDDTKFPSVNADELVDRLPSNGIISDDYWKGWNDAIDAMIIKLQHSERSLNE